jgi:hypothetical protein
VQLYSDGTESAWIEPTVEGQGEPERPAPVLPLVAEGAAPDTATDAGTTGSTTDDHTHAEVSNAPAGLALFLSILALLAGIAGAVLGVRANRRTVSS